MSSQQKNLVYALWQEVPKLVYAFWICKPVNKVLKWKIYNNLVVCRKKVHAFQGKSTTLTPSCTGAELVLTPSCAKVTMYRKLRKGIADSLSNPVLTFNRYNFEVSTCV